MLTLHSFRTAITRAAQLCSTAQGPLCTILLRARWHNDAGPLLNSETPARDWVVLDGYSMASAAPLRPSNVSAGLFGSPEDARFATWQDCRQNCSRTPGCASFRWVRTTRACLHYRNEPNATNLLRPCTNADGTRCKFGYRIPGLCGRTASQSIRCGAPAASPAPFVELPGCHAVRARRTPRGRCVGAAAARACRVSPH